MSAITSARVAIVINSVNKSTIKMIKAVIGGEVPAYMRMEVKLKLRLITNAMESSATVTPSVIAGIAT